MAYRFIYLLRHGNYISERKDPGFGKLTETGIKQAAFVAKYLSHLPIRKVYSSSMPRAKSTADIIMDNMPAAQLEVRDELREGVPVMGFFERRKKKVARSTIVGTRKRMDTAYDEFFRPSVQNSDEHILLVTHGNLIRYFLCKSLRIDPSLWREFILYQGSLTKLRVGQEEGGKIQSRLVSYGEVGFLPYQIHSI